MAREKTALELLMEDYEKTSKEKESSDSGYDLSNYFAITLEDNEKTAERRIRILPSSKKGGLFYEKLYVHEKKVGKSYKKFACLEKHEGKDCPFCEAETELKSTGDFEDKKTANKEYKARLFYVLRVIDRDKEEEGVKFWRIRDSYNGKGIFDQIMALIKRRKVDLSDPEDGRDLIINIARDQNKKPVVSSIIDEPSSPLSEDMEEAKSWIKDPKTWRDVYAVKPYEYLKLVVLGKEPAWDKVNEEWVDKESLLERQNDLDEDTRKSYKVDKKSKYNDEEEETPKSNKSTSSKKSYYDDDEDEDDIPQRGKTTNKVVDEEEQEEDDDDDLPF
jgi:hypothetical protein